MKIHIKVIGKDDEFLRNSLMRRYFFSEKISEKDVKDTKN